MPFFVHLLNNGCSVGNILFSLYSTSLDGKSKHRLIVNFIVPWGSFRAYFCRPDADDGPTHSASLPAASAPAERAWRAFVAGDRAYRNARLKFIPRVVAGPWMVKKMVGSTPVSVLDYALSLLRTVLTPLLH